MNPYSLKYRHMFWLEVQVEHLYLPLQGSKIDLEYKTFTIMYNTGVVSVKDYCS